MKDIIKVQLFGKFIVECGGHTIDEESLRSNKLTKFLAYILTHREQVLTYQTLIDIFWEDDSKNPMGALKNLMYRLRAALKELGDEEYILTLPGSYQWNPQIPVQADYEVFEQLISEAKEKDNQEQKKEICRKALICFNGNVSKKIANESWAVARTTWFQSLYMDGVRMLGTILEEECEWEKLETLCNEALRYDQLDEDLHYWMIKSLHKRKKYELAMQHYEKVSRIFYGMLGIRTTERLRSIFAEMLVERGSWETDIETLGTELVESTRPKTVFVCDYQLFRQIYRMEARRIRRSGMAEYFALLTVRRVGGIARDPVNDSSLMESMTVLEDLLCNNLRIGDVVTRYNMSQFILLLPTCSSEAAKMVIERIRSLFIKQIGKKRLDLIYELSEIVDAERMDGETDD